MIEYTRNDNGKPIIDRCFLAPDDFSPDDKYISCLRARITELSDEIDRLVSRQVVASDEVIQIINNLQANRRY